MLKHWTLENFKPIHGRLELPLAPLTVLAGLNSSGKSSILQSILLISQTLRNPNLDRPLILNGQIVQLGTFDAVRNDRAGDLPIHVGFELFTSIQPVPYPEAPPAARVSAPHVERHRHHLKVNAYFAPAVQSPAEAPGVQAVHAVLTSADIALSGDFFFWSNVPFESDPRKRPVAIDGVSARLRQALAGEIDEYPEPYGNQSKERHIATVTLTSDDSSHEEDMLAHAAHFLPIRVMPRRDRPLAVQSTLAFQLPLSMASQQAINFFTTSIRYVGPLRADPQAVQGFAPSTEPDDVGFRGEYAAAVYDANRAQPIRFWDPVREQLMESRLEDAVNIWARYLGVAHHVSTRASQAGASWMITQMPDKKERPLQAVGVGVSQVLPILITGLLSPEGALLLMEQPELHLHPRAQARLGDFFVGLTRVGKQCIIETHSDCLVNQARYHMVRGGAAMREATAIYFVEQDEQGDAHFNPVQISESGNIENWPDGFFDESLRQEERITEEAVKARLRGTGA